MRNRSAGGWWIPLWMAMALVAAPGCSALRGGSSTCEQRVVEKIRTEHPQARGVKVDSGSVQERHQGSNTVLISGRGQLRTKKGDDRGFSFSCVYNQSSHHVSDVRYHVD